MHFYLTTYIYKNSRVYRILHERGLLERMEHDFVLVADEFHHKTKFTNEMWQTDFTCFKVKGWGWYYLSTVIDDYSRYIIHWELCSSMTSEDVSKTIDKAVEKAGVTLQNPPCLLSDNGPCYIASVRCQIKVHNCKCSYLCCNIILLFSEILLLIEFCFIVSLIFLIFSPCPKYTSLGVRLSNDS